MTALPVVFSTDESKYKFLGSTELINCYAEKQGAQAKAQLAVLPCPGLTLFSAVTSTPCRGTIYLEDEDYAVSVHSTSVYKITYDGTTATKTRLGVIPGTDPVQISRNQADPVQISIHCAIGEYYIENDIVKSVTDAELETPVISQDHVSGYTVYGLENRKFFLSQINECQTVDSTDYATAEQGPDPLVRVKADRGNLFIFKQKSIEPWRNTGNVDFPFEPMPSVLQKGLVASDAVVSSDNTLMWPGDDNIVYRMNGAQPLRISTHGIERTIENDPARENVVGFPHSSEGHSFATFTGTGWTRSYDSATQLWHSRESYGTDKWRAVFPFRAWGKTIFGDRLTGNLYEADSDSFVEGTDPLIWGVDSPILHVFPNGGIVDALRLDVATGVGLLPSTVQGYAPKLILSWSTDGGNTFKGNRELSLGAYGDRVRVSTRRLGRFGPQGIQFRIRVSDPVIRALVAADVSVRPLKR